MSWAPGTPLSLAWHLALGAAAGAGLAWLLVKTVFKWRPSQGKPSSKLRGKPRADQNTTSTADPKR